MQIGEEGKEEDDDDENDENDDGMTVLQGRIHLVRGPLMEMGCVLDAITGTSTNPRSLS